MLGLPWLSGGWSWKGGGRGCKTVTHAACHLVQGRGTLSRGAGHNSLLPLRQEGEAGGLERDWTAEMIIRLFWQSKGS